MIWSPIEIWRFFLHGVVMFQTIGSGNHCWKPRPRELVAGWWERCAKACFCKRLENAIMEAWWVVHCSNPKPYFSCMSCTVWVWTWQSLDISGYVCRKTLKLSWLWFLPLKRQECMLLTIQGLYRNVCAGHWSILICQHWCSISQGNLQSALKWMSQGLSLVCSCMTLVGHLQSL